MLRLVAVYERVKAETLAVMSPNALSQAERRPIHARQQ
jgi:hypothetical protein